MSRNKIMQNYGWVQNTSNLSTVRDTIDLVPQFGITHMELMRLIYQFRYARGDSAKSFSWDARCRIKAIHALGLVDLDRGIQGYQLTELGIKLQQCPKSNEYYRRIRILTDEEIDLFRLGVLTNPPVISVLGLLNEARKNGSVGLSKYDVGGQLGFVGDPGFTHIDPVLVASLGQSFHNREGDSDKWARTIISWLIQVGWVSRAKQHVDILGKHLSVYNALPIVEKVLRYDAQRVVRNVCSEMLCSDSTNHRFPKLVQKRRVVILQALSKEPTTVNKLISAISGYEIEANETTIEYEIINLQRAGFRILKNDLYYQLIDKIKLDVEPGLFAGQVEKETSLDKEIERLIVKYESTIPIKLVDNLLRFGYNGEAGNDFEQTVAQFFRFLGYDTKYYGQGTGRKADAIAKYIAGRYANSYGLIIDAKATGSRYSFPVGDIRKMKEYVEYHGPELLENRIPRHAFAFVSSSFIENVTKPLEEIYSDTSIKGTAISVLTLLELGEKVTLGAITIPEIYECYTNNNLFAI